MPSIPDYSSSDLVLTLKDVGLKQGDTVLLHLALGTLGRPAGCNSMDDVCALFFRTLQSILGEDGTIFVVTYSNSMVAGEVFDPATTPSKMGPCTEFFRLRVATMRSSDPMLSVAGYGPLAELLLSNLPSTTFGQGSFFSRIANCDAKICTVGVGLHWATFRHHAEELFGVPFRFNKVFIGDVIESGIKVQRAWLYNLRMLSDNCFSDGRRLEKLAVASGLCKSYPIGRGAISCINAKAYLDYAIARLREDPWLTASGPAADPMVLEATRSAAYLENHAPDDSVRSSHREADSTFSTVAIVSFELDRISEYICDAVGANCIEFKTGSNCGDWIIPERYTFKSARIFPIVEGQQRAPVIVLPANIRPYSKSFSGEISKEQLYGKCENRNSVTKKLDVLSCYQREWGLILDCMPSELFPDADSYKVEIESDFSFGAMRVSEFSLPGKRPGIAIFVKTARLGSLTKDGLGIDIGIDIARMLRKRASGEYFHRVIFGPEFFGSLAYFSQQYRAGVGGAFVLDLLEDPDDRPMEIFCATTSPSVEEACASVGLTVYPDTSDGRGFISAGQFSDASVLGSPGIDIQNVGVIAGTLPKGDLRFASEVLVKKVMNLISKFEIEEPHITFSSIPVPRFRGIPFLLKHRCSAKLPDQAFATRVACAIDGERDIKRLSSHLGCELGDAMTVTKALADDFLVDYRGR